MRIKTISLTLAMAFLLPGGAYAQKSMGKITGSINDHPINVDVQCEYADPPGLLNARSDWDSFKHADVDGDGIFIQVTGIKAVGTVSVVFHAEDQQYKFGQKNELEQSGLSMSSEFNRQDGSRYRVDFTLECS